MKKTAPESNAMLWGAGVVLLLLFLSAILVLPGWLSARNQVLVTVVGDASGNGFETIYPSDGGAAYDVERQGLSGMLQSEDFRIAGVQYAAELKPDFLVPEVLDNFDVVLLYNAPVCDRTARQVLADFVEQGGQLVAVGDACTRVVDSPQTGWSIGNNRFGAAMPAVFQGVRDVDVRLKIYDVDHPMFNGIMNTWVNGSVSFVQPVTNTSVLAFLNSSDLESGNAFYGILEKPFGKGRVVYFAYDPVPRIVTGVSRNMILNLLLYLDPR